MEATPGRRDQLVERRRLLGFTQESLAQEVGVSPFTVAQWERGKVTPRPRYRPTLAAALGLGVAEVDQLLDPNGSPVMNGHSVSPWFNHYESLVHAASTVHEVEVVALPGLLQTKEYATVIERAGEDARCKDKIAERVERRLRRQDVLYEGDDPLTLDCILPERLFRDEVGGPAVMAGQIDHLLELMELPNLDLRIVPPDGRDACVISGFQLLFNHGAACPFMACTFDVGGVRYHEDPSLVQRFVSRFQHLRSSAMSAEQTRVRLLKHRENYQCRRTPPPPGARAATA